MAKITVKILKKDDFVSKWQVSGPLSKKDVGDLKYKSVWEEISMGDRGYVDLTDHFEEEDCVAYLKTSFQSPKEQAVMFEIGSDDGIKVWLNGDLVHQNKIEEDHNQGENVVEVTLKDGLNEVLLLVNWGTSLVITDLEANPLEGLVF
jgi:hypothetical protein